MRILACTDIHEQIALIPRFSRIIKQEQVDVFVCAGDFSIFGRSTKKILEAFNSLPVPVVFIHGNHEDELEVRSLLKLFPNIHFVHNMPYDYMGYTFLGFGGGGFSLNEPEYEKIAKTHAHAFHAKTVLLMHPPPYGTLLDEVDQDWHVGTQTLTDIIASKQPIIAFCGHIHECFHVRDEIGATMIINPGPDGEVIELEDDEADWVGDLID